MTPTVRVLTPVLVFALVSLAAAQVTVTVAPSPVPVGCPVVMTIANDTAAPISLTTPGGPYQIRDQSGAIVYTPPFYVPIIPVVEPGAVYQWAWSGYAGNPPAPVAPGLYFADVGLPFGVATVPFVIDGTVTAALGQRGVARIGTTRGLQLCAPGVNIQPYVVGVATAPGAIPTCGGVVPLQHDWLLDLSLGPNPYFSGFAGNIVAGTQGVPVSITIPNDPAIVGVTIAAAFVVLDFSLPCIVSRISPAHLITIT